MDSLNSEGITFKKPKDAPSKLRGTTSKRSRSVSTKDLDIDLNILSTFEEPRETIPQRLGLFEQNLDLLQTNLQRVQDKFNDELNNKLTKFIQSSFQLIDRVECIIPIGILESSMSIGENSATFDYIEDKLKNLPGDDHGKVFVSRVQSGTSATTKAVFQKICGQLIDEESYEDEEENEDSSPVKKGQGTSKRGRHFSLYDVKLFLSSVKQKYKIVLLVEDVDYFANSIITQILTLMGCSKLPVLFIFGATHSHFIQNLIPLNSSSEFVLDKFYSVSPTERFNEFMRRVLFDPSNPFRISGPIVSYLESQYQEDSFSVEHVFQSIKFCLRSHFLTGKAAFCSYQSADSYSESNLKHFKDVVEAITCAEETPRKKKKLQTLPPNELLNSSIEDLKQWNFFLQLFCFINLRLPDCPLGNSYSSMYVSSYEGYTNARESDESDPFHRFFKTLSSLPKLDLQILLKELIQFLKKKSQTHNVDLAKDVLIHFEEILTEMEDDSQAKATNDNPEANIKAMKLRKTKSIKELQERLLEAKRQKEGSSAVHAARTKLVESLGKLAKKVFPPLSSLKCSKIFVFNDLNQLINARYPANFLQLNEDITSPGYVFECECCSDLDPSSIDANLPDVSIIQKLFSEHTTKKVDLNLIYHAFLSVVQPIPTGRKSKASASKDAATASYLIRFRRAVGELQHMGFIKRSKSKPDEVNRLTWW